MTAYERDRELTLPANGLPLVEPKCNKLERRFPVEDLSYTGAPDRLQPLR